MSRLLFAIPAILFVVVAVFLFKGLHAPPPQDMPSTLLNEPAPKDALPALSAAFPGFSPADLSRGHVTVVNFFASWCIPCREEAGVLPMLSHIPGVALYGVAYKDLPAKAENYLSDTGNPYQRLALDEAGKAGIDWGITGVPETFVIDGKGTVRMRYQGPLTPEIIKTQLMPAIAEAEGK